MSYRPHVNCRACNWGPSTGPGGTKAASINDRLESVLDLGVMPLSNAFRKSGESRPGHYPVDLLVCPRCHLGQLSAVVDPVVLYDNYPYVTSKSATMREHFDSLWEALRSHGKIESLVEIGSNDGLCLEYLKHLGAERVMGVDPAENLVEISKKRGCPAICSLLDRQAAEMVLGSMGKIDLILARHVFCHVDNWQEFINNVSVMCAKDTLVCIEVPYAQDMIERCEWDTIYSEHLSYLTIRAMQHLLDGTMLKLHDILKFPIHGGAIALLLRRKDSEAKHNGSVQKYLEAEDCSLEKWKAFARQAKDQISNLKLLVNKLKTEGRRVCGYGASAKASQWINACQFTRKDIAFVCDSTPQKIYCTVPGTDIPVVHEGDHWTGCMDYVICFAWNFFPELAAREKRFGHSGFKWVVPVPKIELISA